MRPSKGPKMLRLKKAYQHLGQEMIAHNRMLTCVYETDNSFLSNRNRLN